MTGPIVNAMSADIEDYFQVSAFDGVVSRDQWGSLESRVSANTDRLLAIFADAGVRATCFVLGWVGERVPTLVRRIADGGHEIASHGYAHRLVYEMTPAEFREDLRRAKGILEAVSGSAIEGFRAPSYSITARSLWAFDILVEEGYRYDASVFPIYHDRYGLPSAPRHPHLVERPGGSLWEIPASTVQWGPVNLPVGGGGYFRLLPYAWTRWGLSRVNVAERKPAVFYLHPWELDPGQPRFPAPALSRFRHYRNLQKTEPRLRRLLREFRFAPIREAMRMATPDAAPRALAPAPSNGL